MYNKDRILNSLEKMQQEIECISKGIAAEETNISKEDNTFKIIVQNHQKEPSIGNIGPHILEGDIDTI